MQGHEFKPRPPPKKKKKRKRSVIQTNRGCSFQSHAVERLDIDNLNFKKLNVGQCAELTKPFSVEEVKQVVWNCDSYKSPGPGGINFGFIKDFWPDFQEEFTCFITEFHGNGKLSKGINITFITLIRKIDNSQRVNDFRPISLVSNLYKILSKVLANRLRCVTESVISETQLAFIHRRQILDGHATL